METWLQETFAWLPTGATYYAIVGLISLLESLAGVGILVPGSVLVVFAGFLAAHGQGDYPPLIAAAAAGAILGDLLSYWLGARFGATLLQRPFFRKRRQLLYRAELFFAAHGGKSVFLGRFVGFLRPFIPFVAGGARMRPLPFALFTVVSGILWGIAYPGLGYFCGASWQRVELWTGRLSALVAIVAVLFVLNALFWNRLAPRLARLSARLWKRCAAAWGRLLATAAVVAWHRRHPRLWAFLAERFTLRHGSGLYLTAGFAASALFAALFLWLVRAVRLQRPVVFLDLRLYELMAELRHPAADTFFVLVTHLGGLPVLAMLGVLLLTWLLLDNRDFSAVIVVAGTAGGGALAFLLKALFGRQRPEAFLPSLELLTASFPSAHAFLALVFYGLAVYMLLGTVENWQSRLWLLLSGSFLALLVGCSRIYLGVHWLSDVLGGFALAAVWLTFLITASEMRRRYAGEFPWRTGWEPVRLPERLRLLILAVVTLAVFAGVLAYLAGRLAAL